MKFESAFKFLLFARIFTLSSLLELDSIADCTQLLDLLKLPQIQKEVRAPVAHQYPEAKEIGILLSSDQKLGKDRQLADGVWVAVMDQYGNFVFHPRYFPSGNSADYLVTHGNLESFLLKNGRKDSYVAAALEFRVLNGKLVYFNDKSGRFRGSERALEVAVAKAREMGFPFHPKTNTESVGKYYSTGKKPINDDIHGLASDRAALIHEVRSDPKMNRTLETYESIFRELGKFEFFQSTERPGTLRLEVLLDQFKTDPKIKDSFSGFYTFASLHGITSSDEIEYAIRGIAGQSSFDNEAVLHAGKAVLQSFSQTEQARKIGFTSEVVERIFINKAIESLQPERISSNTPLRVRPGFRALLEAFDDKSILANSKMSAKDHVRSLVNHVFYMNTTDEKVGFLLDLLQKKKKTFVPKFPGSTEVEITLDLKRNPEVLKAWGFETELPLRKPVKEEFRRAVADIHTRISLTQDDPFRMNPEQASFRVLQVAHQKY